MQRLLLRLVSGGGLWAGFEVCGDRGDVALPGLLRRVLLMGLRRLALQQVKVPRLPDSEAADRESASPATGLYWG